MKKTILILIACVAMGCGECRNDGFIIVEISRASNNYCDYTYNDANGRRRGNHFIDKYDKFKIGDTVYLTTNH